MFEGVFPCHHMGQEPEVLNNALSGEIRPELGSLTNLKELFLASNDLSGCVPGSLEDQLEYFGRLSFR